MGDNNISVSMRQSNNIVNDKIDRRNANDLDVIGNAIGDDNIDKKIGKHNKKLVERVVKFEKGGELGDMMNNIKTGEGLTRQQYDELARAAETLHPKELQKLAAHGKISQESANFLIVADSLKDTGFSGDAMGRGLETFLDMSPDGQDYCAETLSDRKFSRSANAVSKSGFLGIRNDKVKFSETEGDLSVEAQRLAFYLTAPRGQDSNVQHFMAGNFDSSNDALLAGFSNLPSFRKLTSDQQGGMIDYFRELGMGGAVSRNRPGAPDGPPPKSGDVKGPEHFEKLGMNKEEVVAISTLMFQVLSDRVSAVDQQVRVYAEGVQDKNNKLKTLNNAMTAVRTDSAGDKKADLSETTFQDSKGQTINLSDYLLKADIIKDPDDLNKVDSVKVDSMLASLKSQSDILSSESTESMTKLQQWIDKYNQSTSQLTSVESNLHNNKMKPINKLDR